MRIEAAATAIGLLLPAAVGAGGWHRLESLACSDCHTMHGSQSHAYASGSPVPATPQAGGDWLSATAPNAGLLKAPADQLCVACHDGTTSFAPDVIAPVGYVADPLAGGFERPVGPSSLGHDLGTPGPIAPPDGATAVVLGCRTCHETHGNANYRNLRPRPSGSTLRPEVTVRVDETVVPDGSNPAQVYVRANADYRAGTSDWCLDCHDRYDPSTSHPADRVLYGSASVDWAWWRALDPAVRVRTENAQDPLVPNREQYDEVFCLSCHKAHGSANPDALIYADGTTLNSTCAQCHHK